jgi:hypothetical protein
MFFQIKDFENRMLRIGCEPKRRDLANVKRMEKFHGKVYACEKFLNVHFSPTIIRMIEQTG